MTKLSCLYSCPPFGTVNRAIVTLWISASIEISFPRLSPIICNSFKLIVKICFSFFVLLQWLLFRSNQSLSLLINFHNFGFSICFVHFDFIWFEWRGNPPTHSILNAAWFLYRDRKQLHFFFCLSFLIIKYQFTCTIWKYKRLKLF